MNKPLLYTRILSLTLTGAMCSISMGSYANTSVTIQGSQSYQQINANEPTSKFKPTPTTTKKLDFEVMDLIIERSILFMGPPTRQLARRQDAYTGSRIVKKQTSPYRLEGNKVVYSIFSASHKKVIGDYLKDLEELPSNVNLTSLPKKDQLAYWFNLHNLALMKTISDYYPEIYPKDIEVPLRSGIKLHDAKILTVDGVALSLRDIREKIVFKHWDSPIVIYGFHDGTLGSPSIPAIAFDRDNITTLLRDNAKEFTNSLRGFQGGKISQFYQEMAPFYFPDFETDLRAHFQKYMRSEVYAEVEKTTNFKFHRDIKTIADTTGGYGKYAAGLNLVSNGESAAIGIPLSLTSFIQERDLKMQILRDKGLYRFGEVIIEDIETIDPDLDLD